MPTPHSPGPAPAAAAPLHATTTDATSGDAAPVMVLLHGVFMDSTLWDRVMPMLPGTPTIRLDMPSHGDSPDMAPGASLDDHVTSVAASLDEMGVRRAVVVGHSWGGMVALRLAHRRPDLVRGLVLSNTPLQRVRGVARAGFHVQRLLLAAGLPPGLYGRMAGRALLGAEHHHAHPDDVTALARRTARMGRRRLRETLRSVLLEPGDALDLLGSLAAPWRAVAGAEDYVLSDEVRDAAGRTGRLHVTRGGHTTPLEDPAAVAAAIRTLRRDLATPVR